MLHKCKRKVISTIDVGFATMSESQADDFLAQPMHLREVYPEPADSLLFDTASLETVKDNAIVALDTNVLLLPYKGSPASLVGITELYAQFAQEGRLVVPAQVIREFLHHRGSHLAGVVQELLDLKSRQIPNAPKHPFLAVLEHSKAIDTAFSQLRESWNTIQSTIDSLTREVAAWNWDDPVSQAYQSIFDKTVVVDHSVPDDEFADELKRRKKLRLPPGYKDTSESTPGGGDLAIWMTLLDVGKKRKQHLLFVTGDGKSDWWYRANNQPIYPRFELIEEYRRISGGLTLNMLSLAKLTEVFGADDSLVTSVREVQAIGSGDGFAVVIEATRLWAEEHFSIAQVSTITDSIEGGPQITVTFDDNSQTFIFIVTGNTILGVLKKKHNVMQSVHEFLNELSDIANARILMILPESVAASSESHLLQSEFRSHRVVSHVGSVNGEGHLKIAWL